MYELIQVADRTFYINCPAKMGLYKASEDEVYLIDSGNDKEAGRKVKKILEANGWKLSAIINTHSNADHCGGNKFLQTRTGCRIFAPGLEAAVINNPVMEPSFLFGGYPFKELRNKFLMAEPSVCEDITSPDFPKELEIIGLKGHFLDMIGIKTPDNVYFLADCLAGENILNKYHIFFIYDVREFLNTLDMAEKLPRGTFVPAHADVTEDIGPLVSVNRAKVFEIIDRLLEICAEPIGFEDILKKVFTGFSLEMDFNQYVLVGSTIRSYLAYLKDQGRLEADIEDLKLFWRTERN